MAKALIVTVGGTTQPLIKSITEHKPEFVCFLCSQESVDLVAAIKQGAKDQLQSQTIPFQDFKVISNDVGDLIRCYEDALKCVNKLKSLGYETDDIVVDYTGGTKTMSVALGLACVAQGYSFSYVSGHQRTKEGLGTVVDGTEEVRTGISPWSLFAVEESQLISTLFNQCQFAAAEQATRRLLGHAGLEIRKRRYFQIVEKLCIAYGLWDRFEHAGAMKILRENLPTFDQFVTDSGAVQYTQLLETLRDNSQWLSQMANDTKGFQKAARCQVIDLVSNAARRAAEGKFDDAVARLYRALEFEGQVSLAEPPLQIQGSDKVPLDKVPDHLREEFHQRHGAPDSPTLKLPLFSTFRLLKEVGHPSGLVFDQYREKLDGILSARNNSILAHGNTPIKESAYESLNQTLCTVLNLTKLIEFPKLPVN